jgi:hypothetical protein
MDLVHDDDYANFLDIDDNDIFIRKYSDDNIAIYNKRLSPSPDLTIIPNLYKPKHNSPTYIPIISSYSSVKILYFLFIMVIIYVIVYYLLGTINVIV